MIRLFIAVAFIALVGACAHEEGVEGKSTIRDQKRCSFYGNSADKIYCATTYTQVLVDPDYYAGRRIMINGWASTDGKAILLYPSKDSMDAIEFNASLLVKEADAPLTLSEYIAGQGDGSARVLVGGVLNFETSDRMADRRFGVLEEVVFMR
ncbi:hypothetical protein [Luteimonas fraxinea]|uniref:Lipoprotein n=1 Tax=Luteimonas fraxinea TaxID=2901869 RepID=A0ABS8UCR4_9GAMM|nr:hypothetical protein [Luteimonas fraxinea]MCD9096680.1 hypothetical protein [Luteimonas fraxinea]MCD9126050.1 hypothetical protein [Luteimonas fraxinea]